MQVLGRTSNRSHDITPEYPVLGKAWCIQKSVHDSLSFSVACGVVPYPITPPCVAKGVGIREEAISMLTIRAARQLASNLLHYLQIGRYQYVSLVSLLQQFIGQSPKFLGSVETYEVDSG